MSVKQVRTKNNTYNTVKYDSLGNILTPSRIKELKKLRKANHKKTKWVSIESRFGGLCCVCNNKIYIGTEILWNKKNKDTKHKLCAIEPKS
jgi:hypothetical protein